MGLRIGTSVLVTFVVVTGAWAQSTSSDQVEISLPGEGWSVAADLKGFTIDHNGMQADGRYYLMAHQDQPPFAFSIYLEKVPGTADMAGCRDSLAQKSKMVQSIADAFRNSESGQTGFLEYTIDEFKGSKVHQKNLFACMAQGDVYVDLHISKTQYQPQDESRLQSLLQAVRFVDSSGLQTQDKDIRDGSKYYVQGNYPKAIEYYQKALQREKDSHYLNQTTLRVLVDNLGIAYGMTGDLKQAKETFDYGVSKDPAYPLFYYNLACTYGEMGEIKMTEDNLTRAFHYRENAIAGEEMPDPREDSSFQRFMKDEDFRKFLDALVALAK